MKYAVTLSRQAIKELETINEPFYSRIKEAILNLAGNPRPAGCKKLTGRDGWRIRIGHYRVIYEIFDTELVVDVIAVGHRKDVYE